jgi:hypothetical protein
MHQNNSYIEPQDIDTEFQDIDIDIESQCIKKLDTSVELSTSQKIFNNCKILCGLCAIILIIVFIMFFTKV